MKNYYKLYDRGGHWWVLVRSGGRRIRKTTGYPIAEREKAEAEARRIAGPALLESQADAAELAAIQAARLRGQAAKLRAEASRTPLAGAWERWPHVQSRKGSTARDVAARTAKIARDHWRLFAEAMAGAGIVHMEQVAPEVARGYLDGLRGRLSNRTHNMHLGSLRAMYARAALPTGNPFTGLPKFREDSPHREPLTVKQAKALLEVVEGEYRVLVAVMLYTGLRIGDACTLRRELIDLRRGVIRQFRTGKTGAAVEFPIHPSLAAILRRHRARGEYVVPGLAARYLRPNGSQDVSKAVSAAIRAAGAVSEAKGAGGRAVSVYGAHCLRTTFASWCAEAGVPITVIQGWLGHESQEVTRIYARVEGLAARAQMVGRLPAV